MNLDLGSLEDFDCKSDPSRIGTRWTKWKRSFEYYLEAKGVEKDKQKKSLLLNCAGRDVQDIFSTLTDPGPVGEGDTEYKKATRTLDAYFKPQVNTPFQRHVFRQAKQEKDETVDQYLTRLCQLAENCVFGETKDEQIRDQFIDKCRSHNLRKKLLRSGATLTLKTTQEIARAMEDAEKHAKSIENDFKDAAESVNSVGTQKKLSTGKPAKCYRCGKEGHFGKDSVCKARLVSCRKCKKVGHFAVVCNTKGGEKNSKKDSKYSGKRGDVNQVSSDQENAFNINSLGHQDPTLNLGGVDLPDVLVDSRSTSNVVDRKTREELKAKGIKCKPWKYDKKLFTYGSDKPLSTLGEFQSKLIYRNNFCSTYVLL